MRRRRQRRRRRPAAQTQQHPAQRSSSRRLGARTSDVAPLAEVRLDELLGALGRHVAAEQAGAGAARRGVGQVVSAAQGRAAAQVELLLQAGLQALQHLRGRYGRERRAREAARAGAGGVQHCTAGLGWGGALAAAGAPEQG